MQFFSNASEYELLEGDSVVLNCHVRSYGNLEPNVTVEISNGESGRLTLEEYFPLPFTEFTAVQYNMSVASSMSGPFYCNVTAAVAMETVSRTLDLNLHGELFQRVFRLRDNRKAVSKIIQSHILLPSKICSLYLTRSYSTTLPLFYVSLSRPTIIVGRSMIVHFSSRLHGRETVCQCPFGLRL